MLVLSVARAHQCVCSSLLGIKGISTGHTRGMLLLWTMKSDRATAAEAVSPQEIWRGQPDALLSMEGRLNGAFSLAVALSEPPEAILSFIVQIQSSHQYPHLQESSDFNIFCHLVKNIIQTSPLAMLKERREVL